MPGATRESVPSSTLHPPHGSHRYTQSRTVVVVEVVVVVVVVVVTVVLVVDVLEASKSVATTRHWRGKLGVKSASVQLQPP